MSGDTGVWAYAIAEDGHLSGRGGQLDLDLSWLTGVGETRVRTAASCGLTALVSDVSLAEFGEAGLRENLENLDWLDEVAREHHHVIDAVARLFPVVPLRLATVYRGDAALCAALAEHHEHLLAVLRRVGGRVEWGVKAYPAQPGPDKAGPDPAGGNPADRDPGPAGGAGLAYLKRRRAQLTAASQAKASAVNAAQAVHADLTARAAGARLHPPQSAQLSGVRQPMLLNAAYLLSPGDAVTFTAAVAGQAAAHRELRIEVTGPWPPYSFADDVDDDDGH